MRKLFPYINDRPETGLIIAAFVYWFLCYAFVPFGIVLFTIGLGGDDQYIRAWLELGYHLVNGVLVFCIMYRYLSDSFYNVQLQKRRFFATVAAACVLMLAAAAVGWGIMALNGRGADVFHAFPVVDQNLFLMNDNTIASLPVPSMICMAVFTPIAVGGMFYAIGFAPAACKSPWRGYAAIILLFAAFYGYEYIWHLDFNTVLTIFLLRLPVHLIACWAYQKADTIWAPIVSLGVFNVAATLACIAVN